MAFRSRYRPLVLPVKPATDLIHDGWISLMISMVAQVRLIDRPLVTYRQHSGQQLGVILRKFNASGRERHDEFIENRMLALERLAWMREMFSGDDLIRRLSEFSGGKPIDRKTMLQKVDESIREVRIALNHLKFRKSLSAARIARLGPILKELTSGRYRQYSRGIQSAAADLIRS